MDDRDQDSSPSRGRSPFTAWPRPVTETSSSSLRGLIAAYREISSSLKMEHVLTTLLHASTELIGAENSAVFFPEPDGLHLRFQYFQGTADGRTLRDIRIPAEHSLAGWVARERQPARVDDPESDPRFFSGVDARTGLRTRCILAEPLIIEDELLGVVEVVNKVGRETFTDEDEEVLEVLAHHAARAIANSRVYERLQREKALVDAMLASISDGLIVLDEENRPTLTNTSAEQLFDLHKGADLREEDLSLPLKVLLRDTAEAGSTMTDADLVLMKPEGVVLSTRATPMVGVRGRDLGRVMRFSNSTEQRAEERRRGQFLAMVAHRLESALRRVEGLPPSPDPRDEPLQHASWRELGRLVQSFLYYSDIEAGPLRILRSDVCLKTLVREVVERRREELARHGVRLLKKLGRPTKKVYIDRDRTTHVLTALLETSQDLMPTGGTLQVSARRQREEQSITLGGTLTQPALADRVEDLLDRDRMVERYLSTPEEEIDLSLAFAGHIVDAQGGDLIFRRKQETFEFTFTVPE